MTSEIEISFSLPDPDQIVLEVWERYNNGRQAYIDAVKKRGGTAESLATDYHGALELIRANIVHVYGPDEFLALIRSADQSKTQLAVMWLIIKQVAKPIEAALVAPLPWKVFSKESSDTSTTQAEKPAQQS